MPSAADTVPAGQPVPPTPSVPIEPAAKAGAAGDSMPMASRPPTAALEMDMEVASDLDMGAPTSLRSCRRQGPDAGLRRQGIVGVTPYSAKVSLLAAPVKGPAKATSVTTSFSAKLWPTAAEKVTSSSGVSVVVQSAPTLKVSKLPLCAGVLAANRLLPLIVSVAAPVDSQSLARVAERTTLLPASGAISTPPFTYPPKKLPLVAALAESCPCSSCSRAKSSGRGSARHGGPISPNGRSKASSGANIAQGA